MRSSISHVKQPWWLKLTGSIIGFEGEGDGGTGAGGEGAGAGDGTGEGDPGDGAGSDGGSGEGDGGKDDASGLKSALEKERTERKTLEKELKRLQKAEAERANAEKSEIERATDAEKTTAAKVEKLAAGFRSNAVETAILKAAGAAKFRDPSDALRPEVIAAVSVDQDEDDPTQVEIDEASVTEAIKKLAKAKPHYLSTDNGSRVNRTKSGSTFGGTGSGNQGDAEKAELLRKYPALRGL